jgi:hypothetical protein
LHHHLGNVLVALGEPTQAASSFRQAVDHERLALYHDPGDRDALGRLDKHHERLGQSLRAAGQPLAAALVARQRLALKSRGDANALATAGIELAQCVELLQAGTPDERELATDFSNESIDLMQHAVEAGYRDVLQFVQVLHAQHADLRPQVKQMLAAWLDTAWPSNPFAH